MMKKREWKTNNTRKRETRDCVRVKKDRNQMKSVHERMHKRLYIIGYVCNMRVHIVTKAIAEPNKLNDTPSVRDLN